MQIYRAPARIPLFVRVVGKNSDDSPKVVSLKQTINLYDQISVNRSDSDHFESLSPLILEAIALYRKKTKNTDTFSVKLERNLPTHAALGEESSHAATVLWALNQFSNTPVPEETLQDWGAELNSEVPFFFTTGTAKCSDNTLESLEPLPEQRVWIVASEHDMPKTAVFNRLNLLELQDRQLEQILDRYIGFPEYFNDFEEAAFALNPKLALLKQQVKDKGFRSVVMAETGSSLFCLDPKAEPDPDDQLISTHYLNRRKGHWY